MAEREDTTEIIAERIAAETLSGWNGSLSVFVPEPRQVDACRPEYAARIAAVREQCAKRAGLL